MRVVGQNLSPLLPEKGCSVAGGVVVLSLQYPPPHNILVRSKMIELWHAQWPVQIVAD